MSEIDRYRENVGRDPETRFPDDPDWRYRGRKDEKEDMLDRFDLRKEEDTVVGQEKLFDA